MLICRIDDTMMYTVALIELIADNGKDTFSTHLIYPVC